jgi:hypothetical protein
MKDILLRKPKARTAILFRTDKEDDWFINVIRFELKSGKQISNSIIIKKDVEQWLDGFTQKGWIVVDDKDSSIVEKETL